MRGSGWADCAAVDEGNGVALTPFTPFTKATVDPGIYRPRPDLSQPAPSQPPATPFGRKKPDYKFAINPANLNGL